MMKEADNLFGSSSTCTTFSPPKGARDDARASPSSTRRCCADRSLRKTSPELFAELVRQYVALLDEAVDQRIHQGESLSAELGDLSARLIQLRASARDIIELHARALDDKLTTVPQRLARVYVDEGRFVVLELMGRLLSDYRTAFLQATQQSGQGSTRFASTEVHRETKE
jgi:hypothetical protein